MLRHLIKVLRIVPTGDGYVQWSLKLAMPKKDGAVPLAPCPSLPLGEISPPNRVWGARWSR